MDITKGGRGKEAPYKTTHVRVPEPIKAEIQELIDGYKQRVSNGEIDPKEVHQNVLWTSILFDVDENMLLDSVNEILRQKKGAKDSLIKLVNKLYGTNLTTKDLLKKNDNDRV